MTTKEDEIDYIGDANVIPDDAELRSLAAEVQRLRRLELEVERLETSLKLAKETAREISERTIPALMEEIGISGVTLPDGTRVQLEDFLFASITEKNRPAVMRWLRDTGNDAIIKSKVSVAFGKGELSRASQVVEDLKTWGYSPTLVEEVHTGSFKAVVRDMLQEPGVVIPLDLLGCHYGRRTLLK